MKKKQSESYKVTFVSLSRRTDRSPAELRHNIIGPQLPPMKRSVSKILTPMPYVMKRPTGNCTFEQHHTWSTDCLLYEESGNNRCFDLFYHGSFKTKEMICSAVKLQDVMYCWELCCQLLWRQDLPPRHERWVGKAILHDLTFQVVFIRLYVLW